MPRDLMVRHMNETPLEMVDRLPPALRELVHELGLSIVTHFHLAGVTDPGKIRHLVRTVRLGAREPGNRFAARNHPAMGVLRHLDAFLVQEGCGCTAQQVVRAIRDVNWTVVPFATLPEARAAVEEADARLWGKR